MDKENNEIDVYRVITTSGDYVYFKSLHEAGRFVADEQDDLSAIEIEEASGRGELRIAKERMLRSAFEELREED